MKVSLVVVPVLRCLLAAILSHALACNGEEEPGGACVAELPLDCEPAYDPTFEDFYAFEIEGTCGANGSSCHGPTGNKGNLTLADPDSAYDALINSGLVIPGDPECSVLIQRLESNDPNFVMPPQSEGLSEGKRCAIRQWVANGAKRQ